MGFLILYNFAFRDWYLLFYFVSSFAFLVGSVGIWLEVCFSVCYFRVFKFRLTEKLPSKSKIQNLGIYLLLFTGEVFPECPNFWSILLRVLESSRCIEKRRIRIKLYISIWAPYTYPGVVWGYSWVSLFGWGILVVWIGPS